MKITHVSSISEMIRKRSQIAHSQTIGFVPTMGYLHDGHLSLVKNAREENDIVIVSVFVNPTQFGPKEDLSRYPRDIKRDIRLLEKAGVDIIFTPSAEEIYPNNFQTYVELTSPLIYEVEGAARPGHFRGVATIVLKLFNLVKPTNAYFGQKDAQQAIVVYRMIKDLNLDVTQHILPTIREQDGLAMSSRNSYLNPTERKAAPILYKALLNGQKAFETYLGRDISHVKQAVEETIKKESLISLQYVEIRHPVTFVPLKKLKKPALLLIAAKIGTTRLIDNIVL